MTKKEEKKGSIDKAKTSIDEGEKSDKAKITETLPPPPPTTDKEEPEPTPEEDWEEDWEEGDGDAEITISPKPSKSDLSNPPSPPPDPEDGEAEEEEEAEGEDEDEGSHRKSFSSQMGDGITLEIENLILEDNSEDLDQDEISNLLNEIKGAIAGDYEANVELLHDNKGSFDDENRIESESDIQSDQSDVSISDDDDPDWEEINVDLGSASESRIPTPPRILTSEEQFMQLMQIPESPAKERMSKEALLEDVKDPILKVLDAANAYDHLGTTEGDLYESTAEVRFNRCPSIESFFRQQTMVDVAIYLFPGKKMISKEVRLSANIYQLKLAISRYCKVDPERLELRRNRSLVADTKTLQEIGGKPGKRMKFTVEINKRFPGATDLKIRDEEDDVVPFKPDTTRVVKFSMRDENGKEVTHQRTMHITYPTSPKHMIGGHMDQRTKKIYHDATTSPMECIQKIKNLTKSIKYKDRVMNTASLQTFNEEDLYTQTPLNQATQMERSDYYVSAKKDTYLYSGKYLSYEQIQERKAKATITIQRYVRRWLAKKELYFRMEGLIAKVAWAENIRKGRLDQRKKIMEDELARQQCPCKLIDLELLYRAINAWRLEQETYVKTNRWGAERKAALANLTEMESDLLLELERTKQNIILNGREEHTHRQFIMMGQPKRWFGSQSSFFVSYDTDGRRQCRALHKMYKALVKKVENTPEAIQERLDVICKVNEVIILERHMSQGVHPMADMLIQLITRELKFISAKASPTLLEGVRRRYMLFWFIPCNMECTYEGCVKKAAGELPFSPIHVCFKLMG